MLVTERITPDHDLATLVTQINAACWDEANDMAAYSVNDLATYLECSDTVFVTCHRVDGPTRALAGIASGRLEIKPYAGERWLYVDEVDVCVDQRRIGAGKAMMEELFELAVEAGCVEVWLGTEADNQPANALYGSLDPSERETFVGYAWEISPD